MRVEIKRTEARNMPHLVEMNAKNLAMNVTIRKNHARNLTMHETSGKATKKGLQYAKLSGKYMPRVLKRRTQ